MNVLYQSHFLNLHKQTTNKRVVYIKIVFLTGNAGLRFTTMSVEKNFIELKRDMVTIFVKNYFPFLIFTVLQ